MALSDHLSQLHVRARRCEHLPAGHWRGDAVLVGPCPGRQIDVQLARHGQPLQRGRLALRHRHHHPRQGCRRERAVDEQHGVDRARVDGDLLHACVRLTPGRRLSGGGRIALDAGGDGCRHRYVFVDLARDRDVVHVRGGAHDGCVARRGDSTSSQTRSWYASMPASVIDTMSIDVGRSLAALVIDEPAHVFRPSAMPHGRADHVMNPLELRDEIPAGPAQFEDRFGAQALPTVCLDLCHGQSNPNRSQMAPMSLEPERELLVVRGLVCERRHRNAEHLGAHVRALESTVKVGPNHAVAAEAVGGPVLERGEWRRGDRRVGDSHADVDLVPAERHAACRRRANGSRLFLPRQTSSSRESGPGRGAIARSDSIPVGSSNAPAQHLEPATDADHRARPSRADRGSSRPGRRRGATSDRQSCSCCQAG